MDKKLVKKIRREVYDLFLDDAGDRQFSYVRRDWIFPNHIDVMLDLVDEMIVKYGGNETVCKIAVILHDVGLVYGRESSSPAGHEERSVEYAEKILEKYDVDEKMRGEIISCIEATSGGEEPRAINERIVSTADALSQFVGVHFFAKAAFSGNWDFYSGWLKKKAVNNFKKICFEDERKRAEPVRDYIVNAFKLYDKKSDRGD